MALAVYFPLTCFYHLRFSLWLVRGRAVTLSGHTHDYAYAHAVPWLGAIAAAALAWHLSIQARRSAKPWPVLGYWFAWLACVALVDRYLTYSANEYVHYPQYAVLGWGLARIFDPRRSRWPLGRMLFWATLLGAVDESLQYLWITRSYSEYLDFNDFLVNLLGAAAGVMLYYGFAPRRQGMVNPPAYAELLLAGSIAFAACWGVLSGRLVTDPAAAAHPAPSAMQRHGGQTRLFLQRGQARYGSLLPGKRHGRFFVLPPEAGVPMLLLAGFVFSRFPAWGTRRTPRGNPGRS